MDLDLTYPNEPYIKKVLFNLKTPTKDGLVLNISSKTTKTRLIYSCFHEYNNLLAIASNTGSIHIIDYCSCKFWKLPQQYFCSAISFSALNSEELLIGIQTGDIVIVNFESGCVCGKLEGHQLGVKNFSFTQKHHCMSFSDYEAILWDLTTNSKVRVLHLEEGVGLKQVTFIPVSCYVLACFKDDFIQIWKFKDFQSVKQFIPLNWKNRSIRSISFTKNGHNMVVAGYLPTLAFFSLDTWKLTKFIQLPEQIISVKHTEFVPQPFDGGCNKIIAILSGQGVIIFYDIDNNIILNELVAQYQISKFYLCPTGRYLAVVLCSGNVQLYNLEKYVSSPESVQVQRAMSVVVNKRKINKRTSEEIANIKCQIDTFLDIDKLKSILEKYGEYPEAHRLKIWEKLLKLPNNLPQYNSVINHVTLASFPELYEKYPLESKISIQALKKLLNNLVTWCPFFANVDFLPVFSFPFVKVFHNKPISCFEAICTIIVNWCQYWFEYFPLPPVNILAIIENLLLEHDPELLHFYRSKNVSPNLYFWSLLETAFSEILSATEWLVLWDHVLTNEVSFLLCAVVAYNIVQRNTLMVFETFEDFYSFFHSQNPVNMKKFIKTTYSVLDNTIEKMHPRQYLERFSSLSNKTYPIFTEYPKVIIEVEERCKKIDEMLDEVLESRIVLQEVDKSELEKQRRRILREEEKRRLIEMEKQYLKICKDKERVLKAEIEKLNKMELSLGDKFKTYPYNEENDDVERKQYLEQLKVLLTQKYKIELSQNPSTETRSKYRELDEKISKIDKSLISVEKLKKITVAAGLALLEKVIKNVDKQTEKDKYDSRKSPNMLKSLQDETRVLENEIISLLGYLGKGHEELTTKDTKLNEYSHYTNKSCKCKTVCSKRVSFSQNL